MLSVLWVCFACFVYQGSDKAVESLQTDFVEDVTKLMNRTRWVSNNGRWRMKERRSRGKMKLIGNEGDCIELDV